LDAAVMAFHIDESEILRRWRLLDADAKRSVLESIRSDITMLGDEHPDDAQIALHVAALRQAHDVLVAVGALGPYDTLTQHERRKARR
jgi:hypothetical protein